jgi:hypothetical protein
LQSVTGSRFPTANPGTITDAIELVDRMMRKAGVARPCIAVAALNPHAGEGGLFGYDEIEMITEQQLETKFSDLAEGVLPPPMIRRIMDACWTVEDLPSAAEIAKMSV